MAKTPEKDQTSLPPFAPSKASLFVEGPLADLTILGLEGTAATFKQEELWAYLNEVTDEVLREFGMIPPQTPGKEGGEL